MKKNTINNYIINTRRFGFGNANFGSYYSFSFTGQC